MKKLLLLCCLAAPVAAPAIAMAQTAGAPPATSASPGQGNGPKFEEVKARMTQRLQEALSCVQAAQNVEALKACRPKHDEHGGPGNSDGGPPQGAPNAWTHPPAQTNP